jgi:uncharacterized protein
MRSYVQLVIRYRFFFLALIAAITIGFGYKASTGIIGSSIANLLFGENPAYLKYLERIEEFGTDDIVVIAYEEPDPLAPDSLRRLKRITRSIEDKKEIRRLTSLLDLQHTYVENDTLYVKRYADQARAAETERGQILQQMIDDPFAGGLMISEDGKNCAVIIEMSLGRDFSIEDGPRVVREITDLFIAEGYTPDQIHTIGNLATLSEVAKQTYINITEIFPIVCVVLFVTVFVIFRRFWPVFITFGVALLADIWMLGFAVMLDPYINIFVTMSPAVILIVATSDVIHLCSAYLLELATGKSKEEAILVSGTEVGKACLLTSVTTFFGFVSMSFVPTPVFRQMGWVYGFGVAVSLLIAMTLAPILFSLMPEPKQWRGNGSKKRIALIDGIINFCHTVSTKRPWAIVGIFSAILVASIYGCFNLNIDTEFVKRLDEENRIRQDQDYYAEHFAGAYYLELYLETGKDQGVLDPEVFEKIVKFQQEVEKFPNVDRAISIVDLLRTIHFEFNPELAEKPLQLSGEQLAQYLLLFEMSGGEDIDQFIDFKRGTMRINARLSESSLRAGAEAGNKAVALSTGIFGDAVVVEPTGLVYLAGEWLDEIISGQRRGLIFAFSVIALLMVIGLRSIRAGLWSMLPNALPLIVVGGVVGFVWQPIDSDALAVAMIAIGIGVDDTIHFLMRLRLELQRSGDMNEAVKRTFHFSGRAIIITSIILVCGFSPFIISDYLSIRLYGYLLPLTMFVALVADLIMVPSLVILGVIHFGKRLEKR